MVYHVQLILIYTKEEVIRLKRYRNNKSNYKRGNYKVILKHIGKVYRSVGAIQYQYAKRYLKYHDYKYSGSAKQLKSHAITSLKKNYPYRNEKYCNITIKPLNTSIDVHFRVRCYSGATHSDMNNVDNLPKYINDNYSNGDVVLARLIDTYDYSVLLTGIEHLQNQHSLESAKRV